MKRLEIIANQAVEEDIISLLEQAGYDESFTYIHPVYGRGKKGRREGSAVWPETNVMFFIYLDKGNEKMILEGIKQIKEKFPEEGIKCWMGEGPQTSL
ncbi:PG0541 family transporter-associated protein [Spirochaeta cellobiosiphila]|uniref:PG0541 family transporter-associated protein n=1 Tax=Spirochaeta cellobiosiphila TaxID=504483 RepID=UPI0004163EE5|nr:PG0541 family transporter-associated protein [Spirochaeta cellobiosiphila]